MIDTDFIESLRLLFISLLTESRDKSKALPEKSRTYFNGQQDILEIALRHITEAKQRGVLDMDKMRSQVKVISEGTLEDLMQIPQRGGVIEPQIKEEADRLKEGKYKEIDPEGITWEHFSGRVYNMVKRGLIPEQVKPAKRVIEGKTKFFLVKYTREQFNALPKRGRNANKR